MPASLLRDGAALNPGGNGPDGYTRRGDLYVPPSVASAEDTETDSPLATVVEMHPATGTADTDEFPAANTEPTPPESESEPAAPAEPPAPPEDKELVDPERPVTDSTIDIILIRAFNGVYVLSVFIGLIGQIVGFIPLMGLIAAIIAGGAFELIMVTGSTVGFSRIRNNHGWTEAGFFLAISTFCAAVAAYMNFSHWEGLQATFFGCLTVVGYLLHVISHLWTSTRVRRDLQEWERKVAEVKAERKRREDAQRQAYDEWIAEQERKQREAAEAAERAVNAATRRVTAKRPAATSTRKSNKPAAGKKYTDTDLPSLVPTVLQAEATAGEQFGFRRIHRMFPGMTQQQARELAKKVTARRN